jgi:ABC-type oligopeptide transport system ATPase subunit
LLRQKEAMGLSMLFISHDLALATSFADRLAIMDRGRIVEAGTTAEILAEPQHAQTRRLLAAAQRFNTVFDYSEANVASVTRM